MEDVEFYLFIDEIIPRVNELFQLKAWAVLNMLMGCGADGSAWWQAQTLARWLEYSVLFVFVGHRVTKWNT